MEVVYAGEDMPKEFSKSMFLAGPTPRNRDEQESWRPDALKILEDKGYDGVVFVPEPRDGKFKAGGYDDQVEWEEKYLNLTDCIVFWVPRDLTPDSNGYPKMAAFVTNIEWGAWSDSGKVVFGCPEDAEKVTYLKHYCEKYNVTMGETLVETLDNAMELIGSGFERTDGERYVPLFVWKTPSFQSWYKSQITAGNRLEDARVLYTFRPKFKKFVFLWVLKVNVYIESEKRFKNNEFVLARPDISTVCLWYDPSGDDFVGDKLIILVKEFRSPASTDDGFVRELPGGSSFKEGEEPEKVASDEVYEETNFYIDPSRLKKINVRQLAGTFSSHKAHLFAAELDEKELEYFLSQDGVVHGNEEDSERTFIEVYSIDDLLKNNMVDWATLGMIFSAIQKD